MPGHYSIVQYLPDAVRGERINIGVVAFADGELRWRFLRDWHRVRQFGSPDVHYLQQLASEFSRFDEQQLRDVIAHRRGLDIIQFTEPAGSLLELDEILDQSARRFLVERSVDELQRVPGLSVIPLR